MGYGTLLYYINLNEPKPPTLNQTQGVIYKPPKEHQGFLGIGTSILMLRGLGPGESVF